MGFFSTELPAGDVAVQVDSRHQVGSDHERLSISCCIRGPPIAKARRPTGGARRVSVPLPQVLPTINQGTLQELAARHTTHLGGSQRFRASCEVKAPGRDARRQRTACAWKTYLTALRKDRQLYQQGKLERAVADWGVFREITRPQVDWSKHYLLTNENINPTQELCDHFRNTRVNAEVRDLDAHLEDLVSQLHGVARPLTQTEVLEAVTAGKRRKCVGPDGTSTELLLAIVNHPDGLSGLTDFFQGIIVWCHCYQRLGGHLCPSNCGLLP